MENTNFQTGRTDEPLRQAKQKSCRPSTERASTLRGTAAYDGTGFFTFLPTDPVDGRMRGYRRGGTGRLHADGTFRFSAEPLHRSQARLILKLPHGRLSETRRKEILLTLRVSPGDQAKPDHAIVSEAIAAAQELRVYQNTTLAARAKAAARTKTASPIAGKGKLPEAAFPSAKAEEEHSAGGDRTVRQGENLGQGGSLILFRLGHEAESEGFVGRKAGDGGDTPSVPGRTKTASTAARQRRATPGGDPAARGFVGGSAC